MEGKMGYVIHDLQFDTWYAGINRVGGNGWTSYFSNAYVFGTWDEAEAALYALRRIPNSRNEGCIIESE